MTRALIILTLMAILTIGLSNQTPSREKRQLGRDIFDTIGCSPKIAGFVASCNKDLDERTKALREADIPGDAGTCCYFAAYRDCVKSRTLSECGPGAAGLVDNAIRNVQGAVVDKCSNFDYLTPSCIFVLYYPWLVLAAIVFALLAIGCCLGACCC